MSFASFDEAWRWFIGGGALVRAADSVEPAVAGRAQALSFEAPVAQHDALCEVDALLDALAEVSGLEPQPDGHLHVTLRRLGFQVIRKKRPDDVTREEVAAAAARATHILRGVRPLTVLAGPLNVFPDALVLEVHDDGELASLRASLAGAIPGNAPPAIDDAHFLPHISIATFASAAPAAALRQVLPALRPRPPVELRIQRIDLARWWFLGEGDEAAVERDVVRSYRLR